MWDLDSTLRRESAFLDVRKTNGLLISVEDISGK
jgi:hypothetical protein